VCTSLPRTRDRQLVGPVHRTRDRCTVPTPLLMSFCTSDIFEPASVMCDAVKKWDLEGIWRGFGGDLEGRSGIWRGFGGDLEGIWRGFGGDLENRQGGSTGGLTPQAHGLSLL